MLPRPKEHVKLAGLSLDGEYLREALYGLALVLLVAALGAGIELIRLERLHAAAADAEQLLAVQAAERAEAKTLALDVARYQEYSREAQAMRDSGARAAVAIARIGNGTPDHVWLDSIAPAHEGYGVTGQSKSIDALGVAVLSFGRALPGERASLVSTEHHEGETLRFTARLTDPQPDPSPVAGER
ncbi:MAG: hypothetical protein ACLPYS_17080 [Vulcanimicrobiaceae bacterium]